MRKPKVIFKRKMWMVPYKPSDIASFLDDGGLLIQKKKIVSAQKKVLVTITELPKKRMKR